MVIPEVRKPTDTIVTVAEDLDPQLVMFLPHKMNAFKTSVAELISKTE